MAALSPSTQAVTCNTLVPSAHNISIAEEQLIGYLTHLLDLKVITENDLKQFAQNLAQGIWQNPIPKSKMATSEAYIHFRSFEDINADQKLDYVSISNWISELLGNKAEELKQTADASERTKNIFIADFIPVKVLPEEFSVKNYNDSPLKLTHDFEVMRFEVTQYHWLKVMGKLPTDNYVEPENSISVETPGGNLELSPDHPVAFVTWWSAMEFANEMSRQAGLIPVYEFIGNTKDIEDAKVGKWEVGSSKIWFTVESKSNVKIKINAPDGDIFKAEGYRLPTVAEFAYLLSQVDDKEVDESRPKTINYHHSFGTSIIPSRSYYEGVRRNINGQFIYGLYDYFTEWLYDTRDFSHPIGGTNFVSHFQNRFTSLDIYVAGNSSKNSAPIGLYSTYWRTSDHGFRLVRTIKK